jgi:hypothetical protein
MWRGSSICALYASTRYIYIYIKDSNKYDTWVIVESVNIGEGAENFYERTPEIRLGDESVSLDCISLYGELKRGSCVVL